MSYFYSQAKFAKLCRVSRNGINKRVNRGKLILNPSGKIDLQEPINFEYYNKHTGETEMPEISTQKKPPQRAKKSPPKNATTKKPTSKTRSNAESFEKEQLLENEPEKPQGKRVVGDKTRAEAELHKLQAQTANYQLKFAERMNVLILKDMVDRAFGTLYATIVNHILPMGDRLSDLIVNEISEILSKSDVSVTDPEVKIKVKQRIDKENARTLAEIKRVTETKIK